MLNYPNIDPVAFHIWKVQIHWYGIMYVLSFLFCFFASKLRLRNSKNHLLTINIIEDFLFYGAVGTIIGGRLGYCLFYQPQYYINHLPAILQVWNGGMSFHGGIIGVVISMYCYAKKHQLTFFLLADFFATMIPVCLMFGRIGNFINAELLGRVCISKLPWCMVFPQSVVARHPSQLYEALLEGVMLSIIMLIASAKPRSAGKISGIFLCGYAIMRFIAEFFREPDSFATWIVQFSGFSLGQLYCIPMLLIGMYIIFFSVRVKEC